MELYRNVFLSASALSSLIPTTGEFLPRAHPFADRFNQLFMVIQRLQYTHAWYYTGSKNLVMLKRLMCWITWIRMMLIHLSRRADSQFLSKILNSEVSLPQGSTYCWKSGLRTALGRAGCESPKRSPRGFALGRGCVDAPSPKRSFVAILGAVCCCGGLLPLRSGMAESQFFDDILIG